LRDAARTLTAKQALQVGKPGEHEEIEQHIKEHRNERDCEHRHLGDAEPPENAFVAERPEPQQFRQPIEKLEKDGEKSSPQQYQAQGGEEHATRDAG
jgi:hypothetical protein